MKKYGNSEEEMLGFLENAKKELASINTSEQRQIELEKEINELKAEAVEKAEKLTNSRKAAAEKLRSAVLCELRFLNMPGVDFVRRHKANGTDLKRAGRDRISHFGKPRRGSQISFENCVGRELSRTNACAAYRHKR